jgi:hypothetical protein
VHQFLALAHEELVDFLEQIECIFVLERRFFGVNARGYFYCLLRKKLLRPGAGFSPRPVVAPFDALHWRAP